MRHFRPTLRHFGITEQQWRVLRALSSVEHAEVMTLAAATELLPPSLSRLLPDLEARGLIQRQASNEDLRRVLISIAPEGAALLDRVGVYSEMIYGNLTERFGSDRLQQLLQLLKVLEEELNTGPPIGETIDFGPLSAPVPSKRGRPRR